MPTNPAPRSYFQYDKQCSQMSCSPAHFIVKETVAQQDSVSPLLEASVVFLPLESSFLTELPGDLRTKNTGTGKVPSV